MSKWTNEIQTELILLIKDWLRQTGKTQSELCQSLNLTSSRMPTLIDFLKKEFLSGGIPKIASILCETEFSWSKNKELNSNKISISEPSEQLDLLDEICDDLSKFNFEQTN